MGAELDRQVAAAANRGATVRYHDDEFAVIDLRSGSAVADLGVVVGSVICALFVAGAFTMLGLGMILGVVVGAVIGVTITVLGTRRRTVTWELREDGGKVMQRQA